MTCGWLTCFSNVNSDSRSRSSLCEAFSVTEKDETFLIYCHRFPAFRAIFLFGFTFKHFHSDSGVTGLSFQSERRRFDHFPKLAFTQCLAKYEIFTRKLPLRILLWEYQSC